MPLKLYTALLLLLLLAACTKQKPVGETTIVYANERNVTNQLEQTVNIRIYATIHDYNDETNTVFETRLDAGDSTIWTSNQNLKACYVDWFTDGYALSNWGVAPMRLFGGPGPAISSHSYEELGEAVLEYGILNIWDESQGDTAKSIYDTKHLRDVFINTTGTSSRWIVIDKRAQANNVSVWNTAKEYEKHYEYVFNRDMSVKHIYMDESGNSHTNLSTYFIEYDEYPLIKCPLPFDSNSKAALFRNTNPVNGSRYNNDTFFLYPNNYYYYYLLKKIE